MHSFEKTKVEMVYKTLALFLAISTNGRDLKSYPQSHPLDFSLVCTRSKGQNRDSLQAQSLIFAISTNGRDLKSYPQSHPLDFSLVSTRSKGQKPRQYKSYQRPFCHLDQRERSKELSTITPARFLSRIHSFERAKIKSIVYQKITTA